MFQNSFYSSSIYILIVWDVPVSSIGSFTANKIINYYRYYICIYNKGGIYINIDFIDIVDISIISITKVELYSQFSSI
jgi:hypothetical protein